MSPTLIIAASFVMALAGIFILLPRLPMDRPGPRSNHSRLTPRGAGIAVIGASLLCLAWIDAPGAVLLGALALAIVSWRDDTKGISPGARLIWQFLAIMLAWPAMHGSVIGGLLPRWLELPLVVVAWMWFINLYNFMDGIDGIAAAETISIALGFFAIHLAHPDAASQLSLYGGIIAASCTAFWLFNRHPAKVFLGDVGSVPLGFLMGWLLLSLAAQGYFAAALILPAYYLADSGLTLARRAIRRENIFQAHSQHFYQRAVAAGMGHSGVVRRIMAVNLLLIVLAVISTCGIIAALLALAIAYGLVLAQLRRFPKSS